jgi:DNA-binding response OmpR family regulator
LEGRLEKKILIIDDDPSLGTLIEMILKPDGFHVYHAQSGTEGLDQAYKTRPDLIILDIMMPDMDGFTVCARLREMMNIPILMLTAHSTGNNMLQGFNTGVDDFLRKPFSNNELKARVKALLRRASM